MKDTSQKNNKKENRKIVSERIIPGIFADVLVDKPSRFEVWFRLKPLWWYKDFCYWLKKKKQKYTTGFPHEESFDFKSSAAKWMLPRLKHLRDNADGYPPQIIEDNELDTSHLIKEFTHSEKNWDERYKYGIKKWKEIINKIIWSLENINNEPIPTKPDNYDPRCKVIKYDDDSTEYIELDDRDWDWSEVDAYNKKLQEGFDLLGKYYSSLWW
tara:strand:- start:303 stop:941 length:639 start_codon:yes stop_codon:yes gene_type:complete